MSETVEFPTLRPKRAPIKPKLAGDGLEDISVPALIRSTCEDTIEAALMKLAHAFGAEMMEEVNQRCVDRVAEKLRNADHKE